ncbi:condensin complex subunit 2 [Odontomachus brunneus]|uniref:condensin complex subunit 2 n=1 Tax=Odontomachus brunneus TaxID=486640 RepID=UPI0013F1BC74|nr:condensin complex subunit 2 [Odontomachus brunneus]XP_032679783.1 condensin complex subunit 2 [Odontomachus brunneus]XP_032679784.1 condensin complex subunit 2 [Odontomachus brunneus]
MEARKSMHIYKRMETSLNKSPASSSSLRRKSIVAQKQLSSVLSENDDEAERIARRRDIFTPNTSALAGSNKRHSLGLGFLANVPTRQIAESINQCIKLSAENKINIKNAFSLEMIDFMTYMIKKQDNNMSNLQVASTSLDVSSKIYGFRVDSVHTEILKIIGGLDKQALEDAEQDQNKQEAALQENMDIDLEVSKKKKKKKTRQKICSTVEALRGNIEIVKPLSMMIGEGDLQTSDMLYQAMLPNHVTSGFYQHLYNDILVDTVNEESNVNSMKYAIPTIDDFEQLEICASYSNFEFLGWSVEDEPEKMSDTSEVEHDDDDEADNRFQFDLDASVEHEAENPLPELVNYFDIETQDDKYVCERQQRQATTNHVDNIVDASAADGFKLIVAPEYSFVLPNASLHWAGPTHWKFHKFVRPAANAVMSSKVIGACMQAPLKRRKEIELSYEGNKDVIEAKFALSQSNRLQAKTAKTEWSAENLTLPEDIHYDIMRLVKLYLHQHMSIKQQQNEDKTEAADVSDSDRYDYNNPNDTLDYCPDVHNGDYDEARDNNDENECNFEFEDDRNALASSLSQGLTGNNLISAPKLANKISIAYCLRAKRVDMRQLKKSIWRCLKSTSDADITNTAETEMEESTMKDPKMFNNIYKMLPKLLTKNNAEALSVPLFFISLLHLANEKTLNMCSLPDMSDITVERR